MTALATAIVLGLTVALTLAAPHMARSPEAWAPYLRERFWQRAMGWTVVLTVAAALGAGLARGGAVTTALLVLGGALFVVAFGCWIWSKGST